MPRLANTFIATDWQILLQVSYTFSFSWAILSEWNGQLQRYYIMTQSRGLRTGTQLKRSKYFSRIIPHQAVITQLKIELRLSIFIVSYHELQARPVYNVLLGKITPCAEQLWEKYLMHFNYPKFDWATLLNQTAIPFYFGGSPHNWKEHIVWSCDTLSVINTKTWFTDLLFSDSYFNYIVRKDSMYWFRFHVLLPLTWNDIKPPVFLLECLLDLTEFRFSSFRK